MALKFTLKFIYVRFLVCSFRHPQVHLLACKALPLPVFLVVRFSILRLYLIAFSSVCLSVCWWFGSLVFVASMLV